MTTMSATGRAQLLTSLLESLPEDSWAFRGTPDALRSWLASDGNKDLDIWTAGSARAETEALVGRLSRAVVLRFSRPIWLEATVFAADAGPGNTALFDFTFGDLRVGAVTYCTESLISAEGQGFERRLTGVSAASDLLVRPLLRGKVPETDRQDLARHAWQGAGEAKQQQWLDDLRSTLGVRLTSDIETVLDGRPAPRVLALRCERRLRLSSLKSANACRAVWGRRQALLPRPAACQPLKRRVAAVRVGVKSEVPAAMLNDLRAILRSRGYRVHEPKPGLLRVRSAHGSIVIGDCRHHDLYIGTNSGVRESSSSDPVGPTANGVFSVSASVNASEAAGVIETIAHRWYIDDLSAALRLITRRRGAQD